MARGDKNNPRRDGNSQRYKLSALARAVRSFTRAKPKPPDRQIKFESLEPRVLLSADPLTAALLDPFSQEWSQQAETLELNRDMVAQLDPYYEMPSPWGGISFLDDNNRMGERLVLGAALEEISREPMKSQDSWIVDTSATRLENHVVFVDSRVEGYQDLLDSLLPVGEAGYGPLPVVDVVVLDADRDGIEQISEYFDHARGIDAVHILAHGASGSLTLGAATLDGSNLSGYAAQLERWGGSLTGDADVMLYGCDVASGDWGADFVENIAALTGADVAASDDATGRIELGGDWDLELQVGAIEAQLIGEIFDVGVLTGLLQDGSFEVLDVDGSTFGEFTKGQVVSSEILNLSTKTADLEWTIGAKGEITVRAGTDLLKVKGATILFAGSGENIFIIRNGAEFGTSNSDPAQIIGNTAPGSTTILSFTPSPDNADALYTRGRVSDGINKVDLGNPANVVHFGKVWFTAVNVSKVVGGKGNDVFEGRDAASSILVGGRGDDTLTGGSADNDRLEGGVGDDTLIGGAGGDFLIGGADDDKIYGDGDGTEAVAGGNDSLVGGGGDDEYFFFDDWGTDSITEDSGNGSDTLNFKGVTAALNVTVGGTSPLLTVIDAADSTNIATATNVEGVSLGTGANQITIDAAFTASVSGTFTISNGLETTETYNPLTDTTETTYQEAKATLNLSGIAGKGVQITVSTHTDPDSPDNPNGNKVTVKFDSGEKLVVFNVRNIIGTNLKDTVVIEDGARFAGNLNLGAGQDLVTLLGDPSGITGTITGGADFDELVFGADAKLNSLAPGDVPAVALFDVRYSANTSAGSLNTAEFESVSAKGSGAAIFGDDSGMRLTGTSGTDYLSGGDGIDRLIGGSGNDVIIGGMGDDILRGERGDDRYVFTDNWGNDVIEPTLTERTRDTLDFSAVTEDLSYYLIDNQIFVGTGFFDRTDKTFPASSNSLTANKISLGLDALSGSKINKIVTGDGQSRPEQTQTFTFGNAWNTTTIEVPDGASPNLVLDFREIDDPLVFDFKADGSLVVSRVVNPVPGLDLDNLIGEFVADELANKITISQVDANTVIHSGSDTNYYRTDVGVNFAGTLNLYENAKHTVDLGQRSAREDLGSLFSVLGDLFTFQGTELVNELKSVFGPRANAVDLAFGNGENLFAPDGEIIEGIPNVVLNGDARISNVILEAFALNFVQGNTGANEIEAPSARPGVHFLSGLTGADTYKFGNFWGFGLVAELPDLTANGVPLPEATDTLDFSDVFGEDVIVDVYSSIPADAEGELQLILDGYDIAPDWLDSIGLETNFVVARSVLNGVPTSVLFATDIESIVGPSGLGTLEVRMHGDALLRGTVSPGFKGDVVLDYSDFSGPVETRLETLNIPFDDFGIDNILFDLALDLIDIETSFPQSTTGLATGIDGARLGGLTTFYDFFAQLGDEDADGLLEDFAVGTVTKVIGSAFADQHTLGSAAKEYVLGVGDSVLAPAEFDFLGIDTPDLPLLTPDITSIGETTLRFDSSADPGIALNLSSGEMTIGGVSSNILSPTNGTTDEFSYRIFSGAGDDTFTGSGASETFVFAGNWGEDTLDLRQSQPKGVIDKLDFSGADGAVTAEWVGGDLLFSNTDSSGNRNSVLVLGARDLDPGIFEWLPENIVVPDAPQLPDGAGTNLLVAQPAPITTITLDDVESLIPEALQSFDGATLVLDGATEASVLTVQTLVDANGVSVTQLVTDAGDVLVDSSALAISIANLPGTDLSSRDASGAITIDTTAADNGWYTSVTDPGADEPGVDLLTVLAHEIGLKLGLDASLDVMNPVLAAGERVQLPADLGTQGDTSTISLAVLQVDALPAGAISGTDDFSAILDEAIARWSAQQIEIGGAPLADPAAILTGVLVTVDDLDGDELARTLEDGSIVLDYTAAGYGWFIDGAPFDDAEFETTTAGLTAIDTGAAAGRVDLLTAIMHELGHKLGVTHDGTAGALMSSDLGAGERRSVPGGVISLADLDYGDQQELNAGLATFAVWSAGLGQRLDNYLNDINVPFTDKSIPELIGITSSAADLVAAATAGLRDAVAAVLDGSDRDAADILAIDGSTGTNYTFSIARAPSNNPNAFVATIDLLPDGVQTIDFDLSSLALDGADLGFEVSGDLQLTVTSDLQLKVEFGLDRDDEFYVRAPELVAEIDVSSGDAGFNPSVSLGPIGLSVVGGSVELQASARIAVDEFIDSEGLSGPAAVDPAQIVPDSNGKFAIDLPIQVGGSLSGVNSDNVAIRASGILPTGAGDLVSFLQGMDIQFENFDQLFSLRGVSLDDLLGGIVTVIDALVGTNQDGLLYKTIPGINQSVAGLLSDQLGLDGADLLTHIKTEIQTVQEEQSLTGVQDALNGIFNDLFGDGTDPVTIRLEDSVLILDLEFEKLVARFDQNGDPDGPAFDLDLATFASELGLDDLVGAANVAAIADKLKIGSTGINLFADIIVGFNIGVGVDLRDITNPEQIISSDTGISVRLDAGLDPVDFDVSLDISDIDLGSILNIAGFDALPDLDTVGFGIQQATADLDLLIEFGLPDSPDGFYDIDAIPAAEINASGQAAIDLPLVLGDRPIGGSAEDLNGDGFADNVLHVGATFADGDFDFEFASPGMDQLISLAGFLNDPDNVIAGLDKIFEVIETKFSGELSSLDLPFIGDSLKGAEGFFDDGVDGSGTDLRDKVIGKINELRALPGNENATTIDLIADALVLGLNEFLPPDAADALGVTLGGDFVEFNLELAGTLFSEEVLIDLNLPEGFEDLLTFGPDGKVMIDLGYTFAFGFGFSIEDGFYLNTDGATEGGEEFLLDLSATVEGLEITGALPILSVNIRDLTGDAKDNDDLASGIFGSFSVDLQDSTNDGKLTIGEDATVEARLVAEANVDFELTVAIGPSPDSVIFPTITTTFRYDQVLADIGTSGSSVLNTPTVVFEDVELDLGEFVTTFVAPIVDVIGGVVTPLEPIVDFINEPITLIMDLVGTDDPITLLTIAEGLVDSGIITDPKTKKGIESAVTFGNALTSVSNLVEQVQTYVANAGTDPLVINFGNFTVLGEEPATPPASEDDISDQLADSGQAGALTSSLSGGGFEFPILTNPSTIFGLLTGETVDLFIYNLPELDFNFEYKRSFPIFAGLNARFEGSVGASANFSFGFDTSGFNAWKDRDFALSNVDLIFDGFFLSDHAEVDENGNYISDLPEAEISAGIFAGASVGVSGLVEAGVVGGVRGNILFDFNDVPNGITDPFSEIPEGYDGKLKFSELELRLLQTDELFPGFVIPCVFDINGQVSFGLDAFFWIGVDLGFFGKATIFEARETFLSGVLASFNFNCPDPEQVPLSTFDAATGTLTIDESKADGAFTVSRETVIIDDVETDVLLIRTGAQFERVNLAEVNVQKLVFNGTEGVDQLVIGSGLDGIELEIDGRGGDDRIALASGGLGSTRVYVRGGSGNDEIVVAETVLGNLDIDGGDDNDHIMVSSDGTNTVLIRGGSGNDTIIGSDYADTIYGDGGRDVLYGMGGSDVIYGGDLDQAAFDAEVAAAKAAGQLPPQVDDVILGGEGADELHGGTGDDRLFGEEGSDELYGDDGDDTLTGGLDVDEIYGGRDSDTIVWGYGDGEDAVWDGGDGTSADPDRRIDTVQLSGVVFDENGNTVAVDDTVTLSRAGATDDVTVDWERTGEAGSERTFDLTNVEQVIVSLGSGNDDMTVNDLDQTTLESVNVNFGTTETIVEEEIENQDGETEIFQVRDVSTDAGTDILNLFGSTDEDIFTVETTPTGLLVTQAKPTAAAADRNILTVSIFNAENTSDRLNIDTGDNDDVIDASAITQNYLTALGITAGDDADIVIGSPFIDDIDSGLGNDEVTGGAGVDLFTDAGGYDKLFEARDVNYTLSDVELVVEMLDEGIAVEQPDGSFKVTRNVTGSEVEDISGGAGGIFEEVYLTGSSLSEGLDGVYSVNVFNIAEFTGDAFLNGGAAADIYNIQLSGGAAATFTSFIDIIDDGGADGAGVDVLNIEGTNEDDTFLFDRDIVQRISAGDNPEALATFQRAEEFTTAIDVRNKGSLGADVNVQTVNYVSTEDMVIHGRGGNDLFIVDDSSTELFVYGDSGDDSFFIGSVLKTTFVPNPNGTGELIEVVDRDGGLTNGVSFPAEFYGGKGNDYFEVNHNIAEISLFGQDGDDIFFLKALLTTVPQATDNYQAQEDINVYSEAGESDTLAYVNNAPVNIFGGEGFDTLVIVGTVIDDTFVIFTEFDPEQGKEVQRIYGAGLIVPVIDSVERIQIITGAGDDTVYLYGTLDDQEILINTGGGNDLVQIGGDEFSFDVTIPESSYTRVNRIPQPDIVTTETEITPERIYYQWEYGRLFGFFGPSWIPTLVRKVDPAREITRITRTTVPPLEVTEVITVPEFSLEITVPESRDLDSISGPVFIDGQQAAAGGNDAIIVDNRNGLTSNPGILQKTTVEAADINTTEDEVAAAKPLLDAALPGGVAVDVVYGSVVSYLEDQNRVRQQGLLDDMLVNPGGTTAIELRPGQRIQVFDNLGDLGSYLGTASEGTYSEVNAVTGVTETKTFDIASLLPSGGNEFLPDDVFNVDVGGELGLLEVELLYDVNGDLTSINVFAESGLSFDLSNAFVQSKTLDADSTRTYDALSGFGLGVGIFYENFSLVDIQLSNASDVLTINDTTETAVTNVFAGGGDDRIEINDTSGTLNIFGDVAGSDTGGLGILSGVAGTYAEDYRDADNAAAIGAALGLGVSFDADNVGHIRQLIKVLNVEFPATVNIPNPDTEIFNVINLDVNDYRAQIWELLKIEINTLQGENGDYRDFLIAASDSPFANFATDLASYVGKTGVFDPTDGAHLAALAAKVNAKNFPLTVEIDLAGNANELRRDLDVFSSFVSQLLGPGDGNLDLADGAVISSYRDYLPVLGEALKLGQDFDLNNRSHLQLLAGLVNNRGYTTTVAIGTTGTAEEITAALGTFQSFVWQTLKEDLRRADASPYNQLAETGDYRTQLPTLGSVLGLGGAFRADVVADVKALSARLNDQFNDLGIDVDGIRLEPNIDLGVYELEIWKLITEVDPLVAVPTGNDTVNVESTGAEVTIYGQDGNDIVNLNNSTLGGWLTALGQGGDDDFNLNEIQSLTGSNDRGDGRGEIRDSVDLDGGDGSDDYNLDLTGTSDYRVNVLDTGSDGVDDLTIDGTALADTFLLRQVTELPNYDADTPAFVALVQGSLDEILANAPTRPDSYERINYDANINGFLTVNGLAGNDYFASDDNAARTILDGGADKDTFQIGQIYRTPRVVDSVLAEDAFDTIETTRGFLSSGVSYETTIIGGSEDDRITVYSNQAELTLQGNGGNDSFEVRAFELADGSGFSTDSGTDIETGDGDDTVQYNVNAAVNIDGGEGFDSIVVLGTESDDNFVITDLGVFGAGLTVFYENAESVQIDGLEGNDSFFIQSTAADVVTTVIGGLGSDTFNVGGDITEEISSAGWDGITVQDHTLTGIQGPLIIEGSYLEGANRSLAAPLVLPDELNETNPDGSVLSFSGTGEASALDLMQIGQTAAAAALTRTGGAAGDYEALVGLTVEITDGAGEGRFWSIEAVSEIDVDGDGTTDRIELSLRNPSVLESAGVADIGVPDDSSLFAVSELSANFFADESAQIDRLNVFNDGSLTDDVGTLAAIDGDNELIPLGAPLNLSGLGMGAGYTADLGTPDTADDIDFAGGITMDDLEILEIMLGQGNDTLTIEDTLRNPEDHGGITIVHGGGNRILDADDTIGNLAGEMGGDTIIVNGGGGAGSPLVVYGDTSQDGRRYTGTSATAEDTPLASQFDNAGNDFIDARNTDESVTLYGGAGNDTIWGGAAGDNLAGGSGNDEIHGQGGTDLIYGDSGFNVDEISRLLSVPTINASTNPNRDDLAVGNDTLSGDGGEDVIFGDHGIVTQVDPAAALWTTAHAAITRIESTVLDQGGDDILYGGADADILIGGSNTVNGDDRGGDAIDGGAGDDLIFGDNVVMAHRAPGVGQTADPRIRVLNGTELYDGQGGIAANSTVTSGHPDVQGAWAEYEIVDLNHSLDLQTAGGRNFGDDYIAGGADDDTIFGQLGDDIIQGDGGIGDGLTDRVGAGRDETTGELTVNASTEAATDGDDYIEGNGGDDVIFGNLGQDDIIGGSSSLFTLDDSDDLVADGLRPDGSDMIFGGSGERIGRNYETPDGDLLIDSPHANDSDAIAGDNASIYRIVGIEGTDSGAFLTFEYDQGRGPERIVVRAVDLIDYTPGGEEYDADAVFDIGAGDEIHGESGDDFIYGMKGSDYLYGDGEDDDIVGGYGHDWISGGSGSDGVLGDDGRIYTSRNTNLDDLADGELAEPLYGIEGLEDTDLEISTPGNAQIAIINVAGELKKTVNLTPFNVDPMENTLYDAQDADDIIFGGLGDDYLHGGPGDDAISGAEAIAGGFAVLYGDGTDANREDGVLLTFGFDNPGNPGNVLGYSALRAGEFAEYDEFNPRVRIETETGQQYFLNFNANEGEPLTDGSWSDGDDVIFGDLGNDWIVGGTGRDNMYGGYGDDLLNADDDLGTSGGLNDTTDTAERYGDRAFGGAGRDVLMANTGADRLTDWAGEFNTYLVPFGVFGAPTISRALPPSLFDFLYDLSASDGADPTRGADEGVGADDPRNGEPYGELGLVTQKDFDWQAQTGAPADVQPGNIPGGERDVVQVATFNDGSADAFLADVGQWSVENSRLQVAPEFLGGDAASVYYVDDVLPSYFEIQATIQAGKPTGGYKSNSYLIFDYQSPTDFKFAGINISTDKLEMGHRDENGWHVDVQLPSQLKPDRDYNLLLAINGTTATLLVNNQNFMTHTFEARVDEDGYSYGLNSGLVGIGAVNSIARIDNVRVQVLPKDVMPVRQNDFESGLADFLSGDSVGQWSVADGYIVGNSLIGGLSTQWGGKVAFTTSDVRIAAGQILEIETTLQAGTTGGVVFDQYGETDFKFVFIDANGLVSIGHQSGSSWGIEASAQMPAQVQGDYDIKVSLVGSTVNVIIDNQTVVSYAYNALTGDGAIGLLAAGSNIRFDDIVISTNDPAYLDEITGEPMRASGEASGTPGETLEPGSNLQPMLNAAVARWSEQLGYALPGAENLQIWVTDLNNDLLGLTVGNVIYIDRTAAGLGWYVDRTPDSDSEYDANGQALPGTYAADGVDLLSVVAHEVGHVLGYGHETTGIETLGIGERNLADIEIKSNEFLRERMRQERFDLFNGFLTSQQWHRSHDVVGELVASLEDHSSRIVPVNLGMFESVRRQVPWVFEQTPKTAEATARAMIWDEEAGDFESALPLQREVETDDGTDVLEFLEEVGGWLRGKR